MASLLSDELLSDQLFAGHLFPCPVGDHQNVEPTLTKRVSPLFSKGRLLRNIPAETMSYAHLFNRFNHPVDTAGWGFY